MAAGAYPVSCLNIGTLIHAGVKHVLLVHTTTSKESIVEHVVLDMYSISTNILASGMELEPTLDQLLQAQVQALMLVVYSDNREQMVQQMEEQVGQLQLLQLLLQQQQ